MDSVVPNGPSVSSVGSLFTSDYGKSDLVAIPSGSDPAFQVLFVESVVYRSHLPYVRVHVALFSLTFLVADDGVTFLLGDNGITDLRAV